MNLTKNYFSNSIKEKEEKTIKIGYTEDQATVLEKKHKTTE